MTGWRDSFAKWSWLPKLGIWALLLLWAAQGNVALESFWASGKDQRELNQKISEEDPALQKAARIRMERFGDKIWGKAQTIKSYGHKEYYADLRLLKLENRRIYYRELEECQRTADNLKRVSDWTYDIKMRSADYEKAKMEYWRESSSYARWLKQSDVYKNYFDRRMLEQHEPHKHKSSLDMLLLVLSFLSKLFGWFFTAYWRGLPLIALLYITRMIERGSWVRGRVLELKFLIATIAWPRYIMSYPFNLVRELRVEAELRRLGKAFRQFSPKEIDLVRRIANGSGYKEWLKSHREANKGHFQRTLLLAIVITIIAHALSPLVIRPLASRDGPAIEQSSENDVPITSISENSDRDDRVFSGQAFIPEPGSRRPIVVSLRVAQLLEKLSFDIFVAGIDHVPVSRLFSLRLLFTLN